MDKRITLYRYSNETGDFIREESGLFDHSLGLAMISAAFEKLSKSCNTENAFFLISISNIVEEQMTFCYIKTDKNGDICEMTRICPQTL